jgi:hypothetical protein
MPCLAQVDRTRAMENRERKDEKKEVIMTMILGF